MKHIKSYKLFENKLFDTYGEIINKIDSDIIFIKDKCLELKDLGYYVSVDYTPLTLIVSNPYIDKNEFESFKDPEFYIDIQKNKSMNSFYGDLAERRDIVNSILEEVLNYMSEEGYKILKNENPDGYSDPIKVDPNDFEFLNNPTSYQIVFTIEC